MIWFVGVVDVDFVVGEVEVRLCVFCGDFGEVFVWGY